MILVVVLGAMWLAVLGPGYLRRRRERSRDGVTSVSVFHRQLRVLEHPGPTSLPPAYRLRALPSVTGSEDRNGATAQGPIEPTARPVLTVVGADRLPRPLLAFLGDPDPGEGDGYDRGAGEHDERTGNQAGARAGNPDRSPWRRDPARRAGGSAPATVPVDAYTSIRACKRRRDVFVALVSAVFGTLLLGAIPGAHLVWIVTALAAVVLGCYVVLLVHMRMLADERDRKLRYLPPPVERYADPAGHEAEARYETAYGSRRAGSAR